MKKIRIILEKKNLSGKSRGKIAKKETGTVLEKVHPYTQFMGGGVETGDARVGSIEYIQHTDPNLEHHKTMTAADLQEFSPEKLLSLFVVIKLREFGYVGGRGQYDQPVRHEIMNGPNRYKASEYEQFKAQMDNDGIKAPIINELLNLLKNLPVETEEDLSQKRQSEKEAEERYQRVVIQPEREKRRAEWEASIPGKIEKTIDRTIGEPLRENKAMAAAKAAMSVTPGATQATHSGTIAALGKQAGALSAEKTLARGLIPFVGANLAGILAGVGVGVIIPSELGDGSISGRISSTLKKYFPEADSNTLTAKIIMYNKINDRNALKFPNKSTIHKLASADIEDLQRQLAEKVKQAEPGGPSIAENVEELDFDETLGRPNAEEIRNEPVAAYVIQRLEGAINWLSGRIDDLEIGGDSIAGGPPTEE